MYNIGYDAKRLFNNKTGLGNYSRSLVKALCTAYSSNNYILFTPKISTDSEEYKYFTEFCEVVLPKKYSSFGWRSILVNRDIAKHGVQLYHGLSHEIPFGISRLGIPTVVTIHDIIFKLYPQDFSAFDRWVYNVKWKYACKKASAIIAISEATKQDIIKYFKVPAEKIHVVYQTCDESFEQKHTAEEISRVLQSNTLPPSYILYVGSIIERKNVLSLVQAYHSVVNQIDIPLVIIGNGREQLRIIKNYIAEHSLENKIIIKHGISNEDLPLIYQASNMFVYPSVYEGFGIPLVEAMKSGVPIITSNCSCLPEVAGDAALLVNPQNTNEIAQAMLTLYTNESTRNQLIENGNKRAQLFSFSNFASDTFKVYETLLA